ncbi:MAG: hypothetical protein NC432_00740 [Roseburia sp.]|nr:hypothetical protein [Roseburia sp.]MCM1097330.1 hypothetical protein [Ruminococcus flavefaciens]
MKRKLLLSVTAMSIALLLAACGEDPELTQFQKSVDAFCIRISEIDSSINSIDASSDDAVDELLDCLDDLDLVFQDFGKLDFPEEFDYLEDTAREASDYMSVAVENFHEAYSNDSYNEYTAEYAQGNYNRAYKRIQIIISFLHGTTPEDVDLTGGSE